MRALCCLALLVGCSATKTCKDNTVLLSITLDGAATQADTLDVAVKIGTQTLTDSVQRESSSSTGTIEIDFPSYPRGQRIDVTVDAKAGTSTLGSGTNFTTLNSSCATLPIDVMPAENADLGQADESQPRDLAQPDLAQPSDLAQPRDLARAVDLAGCVPQSASDPVWVDPVLGTDDPVHGASPGGCANKTLTYALQHAWGKINLAPGTYVGGFSLTGNQEVDCDPSLTGVKATLTTSSTGDVVAMAGGNDRLTRCEIACTDNSFPGIDTVSNPSSFDGGIHTIDSCNIHGCSYGVAAGDGVTVVNNSTIRTCSVAGVYFSQAGMIQSNGFADNPVDITCVSGSVSVNGNSNRDGVTDLGASASCQTCSGCPFN